MDLGATIVTAILLLTCIVPFVMMNRNKKKRKKQLLRSLSGLAEKSNCEISEHECWNDSAIGLDNTVSMVFFIRQTKDHEASGQIDLTEILSSRVKNTSRTFVNKDGSGDKVIEKLELAFIYRDKNKPEVLWEFYNNNYDSLTLSGELQLVEKWSKIVNDKITELTQNQTD